MIKKKFMAEIPVNQECYIFMSHIAVLQISDADAERKLSVLKLFLTKPLQKKELYIFN